MTVHLPLVAPHAREHTYCAYCPKLCRHACPVSTVQARETTSPWGKMTALHHVAGGALPMSQVHTEAFWACTGCMRCRTYCDHGTEVGQALAAGRAEAVRAGAAPREATDVIAQHARRESKAMRAASERGAQARATAGRAAHMPGCSAWVRAPEVAEAGVRVAHALAGAAAVQPGCCGLPLLEAGDQAGFLAAATRFLEALAPASEVVFGDPGCLHALAVSASRLGVKASTPMRHVSELAAEHLDALAPSAPLDGPVRYHDACRLGRGLGVYDPPRHVLARLLGRAPDELHERRERGECSGAGGQLPRTDRATSEAVARESLDGHARAGGGLLVTSCVSSRASFRAQGAACVDLVELLDGRIG